MLNPNRGSRGKKYFHDTVLISKQIFLTKKVGPLCFLNMTTDFRHIVKRTEIASVTRTIFFVPLTG